MSAYQQNCSCSNMRLAQESASAWQTMKDVGTPIVRPVSVPQEKAMKRVAMPSNCKIVDIQGIYA